MTEIETSERVDPTVTAVLPLCPVKVADIVAVPAPAAVTMPAEFTVAIVEFELVQVAEELMFAVDPSL